MILEQRGDTDEKIYFGDAIRRNESQTHGLYLRRNEF